MLPVMRTVVIKLTRPVVNGTSLETTGLGKGAFGLGIMLCLVVNFRFWYLTGNDRTLVLVHPVTSSSVSGRHLIVGIGRSVFEERDDVAATC